MWSPRAPTIHVGMSAGQLVVARMGGLWSGTVVACERIPCEATAGHEQWQPAVAALSQWLAQQTGRKTALQVVLASRFVRWQLLPWRAELTTPAEISAYAAMRFRETYGKAAEEWQIQHAAQPPGKAMPCCAIDAALMAELRRTCDAAGAHLAGVTSYFSCAFDRWRKTMGDKAAWFGLIESDNLTLGLLQDGAWLALRNQRFDGDWRDVLPGMMAQIGIAVELADATTPLFLAGNMEPPATVDALPFVWLRPKVPAAHAAAGYRMAMGV